MAIHEFIRHPRQIPLFLSPIPPPPTVEAVTEIGLRLAYPEPFQPGQWLCIRPERRGFGPEWSAIKFSGQVLWCETVEDGYELGVAFASRQAAYVGRMLEQCCQIECYRDEQQRARRALSLEQAAVEWIARHAADFPKFLV